MIKLSIPERNNNPNITIHPGVAQIRAKLDHLPLANARESCIQIHALLKPLNRAPLDLNTRSKIIGMILPLLEDLTSSLRTTYMNAPLPLAEKLTRNALIINTLQTEVSYTYKIIVQDLLEDQAATATGYVQLPQAIYYAMSFLARQLVDTYALYSDEPKHIWGELNQLYLFAEKQQLQDIELNPTNATDEPKPATITNIYRRIVLLSLANPYHLMQGEAVKMFKRLIDWAPNCNIIPHGNKPVPEGQLFVDLKMDAPPLYAPNTANKIRPKEGRLLEINSILDQLNNEIRVLATHSNKTARRNLAKRMERDMYFRWSESWGIRRERMSHRNPTQIPAQAICSLTLAHHFISGGKYFKPEESEVDVQNHGALSLDNNSYDSLSLTPEEHAPWMQENNALTLNTHIEKPRQSSFENNEGASQKDIWVKVFATSVHAVEELMGQKKVEYNTYDCQIINTNQGGYGLTCADRITPSAHSGELLATRTGQYNEGWSIGTIRWMKISSNGNINMGVRIIAEDAQAIATKAVSGIGTGSEYFRALLAPDLDPEQYPTTLITPAAVYDIGSVIILNLGDRILYAKLMRQLESTSTYSQYQFELVKPPKETASDSQK